MYIMKIILLKNIINSRHAHKLCNKITVTQPVKKFPALNGTWRFTAVFARAHKGTHPEPHESSPQAHMHTNLVFSVPPKIY